MKSLEKQSLDALVDTLLTKIGDNARVLGPSAPLTVLDARYVGTLRSLLHQAFPGTPDALFLSVRDDLIVVTREIENPTNLVGFEPSVLRVKAHAGLVDDWRATYGDALNVTIRRSKHLETDLKDCSLTFSEQFFAPRSIIGWAKLTRHLARLCAAMAEMMAASGLKQRNVFRDDKESSLVFANLVTSHGTPMDLTPS